jgi:preprotein translocase subunit SecE
LLLRCCKNVLMDTQTTEQTVAASSHRDTALLVAALALIVGGMFAFYYYQSEFNALVRVLALLASLAAALALGYQTKVGRELWGYAAGARVELRKVVWPSRQESVQATLMIAGLVVIFALVMWGLDTVLLKGVELLTGRGAESGS